MAYTQLILSLLGVCANGPVDLVSLIDDPLYFQSRSIAVKPEKMVELAAKTPKDSKEAIGQLLAIRWLGEHAVEVKKTKSARTALERIASGSKGTGALDFARDYARTALARLDGKPLPAEALALDSVRSESLAWFPGKCSLFGTLDFRLPKGIPAPADDSPRLMLAKALPQRARGEIYALAEKIGNVRLDRVSFGVLPDPNNDRKTRIYLRLTGTGDARAILDFMMQQFKDSTIVKRKGPGGEDIVVADFKGHNPALIFIGGTDLVMAGFSGTGPDLDHGPVVEEVLDILAGKKKSLLAGSYANMLKSTPRGASGLIVGNLPGAWRKALTGRGSPFQSVPQNFNLTLTRTSKGLRCRFAGSAENAKEAKAFIDAVTTLKEKAAEGLKKLPEGVKLSQKTTDALVAVLKSIKLEARDALLTGSATLSNDALKGAYELVFLYFLAQAPDQPRAINREP